MPELTKTQIVITGPKLTEPKDRVLALEEAVRAISEHAGVDPADGTMALLTAAVHLAMRHSGKSAGELVETLAYSLVCATSAADHFFKKPTVQ